MGWRDCVAYELIRQKERASGNLIVTTLPKLNMEQTTDPAPTLMNHGLRWGVIVGIVSILWTVALYAIDYTVMVQLKMLFVSLAIYVGFAIYAGIDYRKAAGGYLSYGKAWQHAMIIFASSALISTLFGLLLYNVIDPELPAKLTDASLDNSRAMMQGFGMPESQIDTELEKARERTANQFTPAGMAMGYGIILIVSAVLALITSIFVKKNEPMEM
jgi:hypothetical protein